MERNPNAFDETLNILLVEDSPYDADLIEVHLIEDYSNLSFSRVYMADALRKALSTSPPHIILSDYSMPGFSGLEALEICKTHAPDIPFIFVSGTIGEERAVEALRNGATDYVLKQDLKRLPHAVQQALTVHRDRRQKKRQQEELARTYGLLNSVFDNTHMLAAYMDTNFNFIQVNRAFAQKCDAEPIYFTGKNYFKVFANPELEDVFTQTVNSGKSHFSFMEELRVSNNSQNSFMVDWSLATTNSYGVVEGLVFTAVDVTERMKKEQEVLQTRQRFQDALNQAPDAVIIIDAGGKITFFSQQAEAYFGYKYDEVLGNSVEMLIPSRFAHSHPHQRDGYAKKPERRAMGALNNLVAQRKDGSEFPVDLNLGPLNWDGGTGTMVVLRDITTRKAQEEELRKLSMVASKIDNGVFIGDRFFYPTWVNQAFVKQTGYALKDIDGRMPHQIFTRKGRGMVQIEGFMNALEQGKSIHKEMQLFKKNGDTYWASINATPVLGRDGKLEQIIAIMNDITTRKKAEFERDDLLRTLEIKVEKRTVELSKANELLGEKNKDITDSINYARHIQEAFIPPVETLEVGTADAFVLNLPKDILSGDFYWKHHCERNNCTYVALGDCTGHGVPGSLMTILAAQLLDRHILGCTEKRDPSIVLREMDRSIIKFLRQDESDSTLKDGMEIILMRIDHAEKNICFSSAGIPLYHFVDDQMHRHKLTKNSVGGYTEGQTKSFGRFEFRYNPGERVYVFSDGYVDQFGGKNGSKMLRKRKESVLTRMQEKPFASHRELLYAFFTAWKGNLDQVDDVMAIGFEL